MVLGSLDKSITYPKSLYYSAKAYGFGYLPNGLVIEPGGWDDETNQWLASLFGFSYERILPDRGIDPDKVWGDYLKRIKNALSQGSAVQVCRGWMGTREKGGQIRSHLGRLFWWEGLTKRNRPDMHYFTVVGIDRSNREIYFHDPIFGWFGTGKYVKCKEELFRKTVERAPWQHRYITIIFKKTNRLPKGEKEIRALLKKRIIKKIKGDPSVYDSVEMWRSFFRLKRVKKSFAHGIKGLKLFKKDLQPERFKRILIFKMKKRNIMPVEVVSWLDLNIYHSSFIASISAEYLEARGKTMEWEWLFRLHLLYEKLRISSLKLRLLFKTTPDLYQAVEKSKPILVQMRKTIDEMINHFQLYLKEALNNFH